MISKTTQSRWWPNARAWLPAITGALLLAFGAGPASAQDKAPAASAPAAKGTPAAASTTTAKGAPAAADTAKIPMAKIEALVAPIALYPDPLLAQTLVASTYPLEIVQLQQWMAKHPGLKDKALADSVAKQPWDPSIQSMAAIPEVVKRLSDDIQWTTELGNAFLAQQSDVMTAVQKMREKAVDKGALTSNEHQTVDTQVVEKQTVIVVQPTNPEVVYVPSYSPTVVYGPPLYYPYPPIYYPPYPPGAAFVSFGIGMMWGAAIWGGPCCGAGWGGNNIYINNNNNFNKINHYGGSGGRGNNNWQHNPSHRGAAPYPDNRIADRFGGQTGGGRAGASQRPAGGAGAAGGRAPSASTRPAGGAGAAGGRAPSASTRPSGGAGGSSARVPNASTQPSRGTPSSQIGGRDVPSSRGGQSGFSGGQGGYSGASARTNSARGASSMGASRGGYSGGGARGGGGGRGGGGRRR